MLTKTTKYFLLFSFLVLGNSAIAQQSDVEAKLDSVNEEIEQISIENMELRTQLAEIQSEIDELKRQSKQKEEEIEMMQQQSSSSE